MKKIALLLIIGLLYALPAGADVVDDGLPATADQALKAHTRAMLAQGVDTQEGLAMTRAMLQNQYPQQHIIQAQERVMAAAHQGLPVEQVMNKAREGMAKNMPPGRVVQAMAQVQSRYAKAHRLTSELTLNAQARSQVGILMAEAMTAGITEGAGSRVMDQLQVRAHTMNPSEADQLAVQTATTTRDMARLGVDADSTADVVCLALQNQFQAREMQQLREQFRDQARQHDVQQLAQRFAHRLQQGTHNLGPGDPRSGAGEGASGFGGSNGSGASGSGAGGSAGGGAGGSSGSGGGSSSGKK